MLPLTRLLPSAVARQTTRRIGAASTGTHNSDSSGWTAAGARAVRGLAAAAATAAAPSASVVACRSSSSWLQHPPPVQLDGTRRRYKHSGKKSPTRGATHGSAAGPASSAPVPPAASKHAAATATPAPRATHAAGKATTTSAHHRKAKPTGTHGTSTPAAAESTAADTKSQVMAEAAHSTAESSDHDSTAHPAPHTVPAFLRPATAATLAAAHVHARAHTVSTDPDPEPASHDPSDSHSHVFLAPSSGPAIAPASATAVPHSAGSGAASTSASASAPTDGTGSSGTDSSDGDAPHPHAMVALPTFLRPAEEPLMQRIRRWKIFPYWTSLGYIISMFGLLVTDILWLRSIIIVSNVFGIAVHYSLKFWTGIYWSKLELLARTRLLRLLLRLLWLSIASSLESLFFICANLVHIALILLDRREVVLNDEEQTLYDAVFSGVFSAQEYRKLLEAATWRDLDAGVELMTQGSEIDTVHLVSRGLCVVEQEKLTPISPEELEQRRRRGDPVRIEQRNINGQMQTVNILDPPSAALAADGTVGALTAVNLPAIGPPSIGQSIATSLLQGGLAWADRFRSHDSIDAHSTPPSPPTQQHVQEPSATPAAAQADTSVSSAAPAPLPPSQIHLHLPPAGGDVPPPAAPPASTPSVSTTGADSLPDAIILPSAPASAAAHLQHHDAAPDSHHLLNVHVDSKVHATPAPETKASNAPTTTISSVTSSTTTPASATVASNATPATSSPESSSTSTSTSATLPAFSAEDDDSLGELEDAADEAGIEAGIPSSNSAEDRETRRAARHREREARKREREAAAEKKRLMSMSALERQFGQTDVKKPVKPAPVANVVTTITGTALTPGDQSHPLPAAPEAESRTAAGSTTPALSAPAAATQPTPSASSSSSAVSPSSIAAAASAAPAVAAAAPVPALPAFQRDPSVVGYIRSSRLIGEMCLVAPSSSPDGADNTYTVAPVSVTTNEPTRVLTWQRASLQRLFFRLPSLAVGWYSVVSTDLVNRLHAQRASAHTAAYKQFLSGVLSDGTVSATQKELLREYRQRNDIPFAFHTQTLIELGWTADDWDRGSTQRGWFDWLRMEAPRSAEASKPHAAHDDTTTHKHE